MKFHVRLDEIYYAVQTFAGHFCHVAGVWRRHWLMGMGLGGLRVSLCPVGGFDLYAALCKSQVSPKVMNFIVIVSIKTHHPETPFSFPLYPTSFFFLFNGHVFRFFYDVPFNCSLCFICAA